MEAADDLQFVWDPVKNRQNQSKHRVSFEEARTVFSDEHALLIADTVHVVGEERFILLGLSMSGRHLVVCHCYREAEDVIRIFSARRANAAERKVYADRWAI